MKRICLSACTALAVALASHSALAAIVYYSNDFEADTTANWAVNGGPSDEAAEFFFDYGTAAGIPIAPNSSGTSTRGLKLRANETGGVFSGLSVSPTGVSLPSTYRLSFDWWDNFNGPAPGGGSGSTQLGTFGVGTSGTVAQWPGGSQDSIYFAATGDGNSSSDWRAYSPTAPTSYVAGTAISNPIYAAPFTTGFDNRNAAHPYYVGLGLVSPPAAQTLLYPQQTGTTLVGSSAFEWHEVEIVKTLTTVTWTVDGVLIATVPAGHDTVDTGNNIFFGRSDSNAGVSTDINDLNLLFTLIDNVSVVPEPASLSLVGLSLLGLLAGRRR